jgi:hypothetical protein
MRPIVADHREITEPRGTASARRSCASQGRENLTELNMITHGEAARMMDERLVRAVRRAEEQSGFKTGIRYSSQGRHLVQVSLMPNRHWWICDMDDDGMLGNCRFLQAEDYARTSEAPLI